MADDEDDDVPELTPEQVKQMARNGKLLLNRYRRWAPHAPSPRANWEVLALANLSRCAYSLETILSLGDVRDLDTVVLTRSLFEHAVVLAWLSIDPVRHYPMVMRSDLIEREKAIADLATFGVVTPGVREAVRRAMVDAGHDPAPN